MKKLLAICIILLSVNTITAVNSLTLTKTNDWDLFWSQYEEVIEENYGLILRPYWDPNWSSAQCWISTEGFEIHDENGNGKFYTNPFDSDPSLYYIIENWKFYLW